MNIFRFLMILMLPLLISCVNTRKAVYFNNLPTIDTFSEIPVPELIIKKNDILSIRINVSNFDADKMFNLPNATNARSSTATGEYIEPAGYLVGRDGFIRLLILGAMKAEGLTEKQLAENIRRELIVRKLLLDPVVEIRHLNFKVSILGEVQRPTVITVPNERITLLEALGLAGDITIFAKRNNVLVIREEGGKRITQKINLNSTELFNSPYYYLKSNDVIYVEPNRARVASATRFNQLLPTIVSALSIAIIVFDRLIR
jgi:polysaccharide export outer membrane protein